MFSDLRLAVNVISGGQVRAKPLYLAIKQQYHQLLLATPILHLLRYCEDTCKVSVGGGTV